METKENLQSAPPSEKGKRSKNKFPSEEMFELLLKARDGIFEPSIPVRPSASPINIDLENGCFYVFPTEKACASRRRACVNEICVKYNNCARSRVWWSPKHNRCLGMVARKMGMKARSANQPGGIDTTVRHGFEGHWLALVERPNPEPVKDKTLIRTYILDKAPGIVQFWVVPPEKLTWSPEDGVSSPSRLSVSSTESPLPSPNMRLTDSVGKDTDQFECKSFDELPFSNFVHQQQNVHINYSTVSTDPDLSFDQEDGFPELGSLLLDSTEPLAHPKRDFSAAQSDAQLFSLDFVPCDQLEQHAEDTIHTGELEGPTEQEEETQFDSKGDSPRNSTPKRGYNECSGVKRKDPNSFDDVFAYEDEEQHKRFYTPFNGRNADLKPDEGEAGLAASLAAFEIFKTVCETFTTEEFQRWYDLYARTLFLPNVARGLKYFMDRGDPRLRPDFMFSPTCRFLPDIPVGTLTYTGSYANGFRISSVDEEAQMLLNLPEHFGAMNDLYEKVVESKLMLLCSHLFFKQMVAQGDLDPHVYWFHTILNSPQMGRRVIRCFSALQGEERESTDNSVRILQIQDVSAVYTEILALPPFPC